MDSDGLVEPVLAILRALAIVEVEYALNGGGDSGETELERVAYRDGRTLRTLPSIPVTIASTGNVVDLDAALDRIAADAPEGDWVNNAGGYGTVIIRPFADDDDLIIDCDITYNDEEDFGDDDDRFVDEDDDFIDPDDGFSDDAPEAGEDAQ